VTAERPPAVLVLDGNQRSALAVVRSLGARGVRVIVAEVVERSLAGSSRFCSRRAVYASPSTDPDRFADDVANLARVHGVGVILPITDVTTGIILRNREQFIGSVLPFPDWDTYDRMTNKNTLLTVAAAAGVRTPATICIASRDDLKTQAGAIRYPAVLKPVYSKVCLNNGWVGTNVLYVDNLRQLEDVTANLPWFGTVPMLIQQRIEGEGQGVFALCDHGRVLVWFAHRRLREKPQTGGVSVLSESIALPETLRLRTERMLSRVKWHGVAMIEYKLDRDGVPYLIEVNGRFWGSLQLAVDAGVDFPWLLYQMAIGRKIEPSASYEVGRRLRWLLGDIDRLYLILKDRHLSAVSKLREVFGFMRIFRFGMRYEVNRFSDPFPFLHELRDYLRALWRLA